MVFLNFVTESASFHWGGKIYKNLGHFFSIIDIFDKPEFYLENYWNRWEDCAILINTFSTEAIWLE